MDLLIHLATIGLLIAILTKVSRISKKIDEVSDQQQINQISSKVKSMIEQVKSIIE